MPKQKFAIRFTRGPDGPYVVEVSGKYYLVSTERQSVLNAAPSDSPLMFLKWGYFEEIDEWPIALNDEIRKILYLNNLIS